MLCNGFRWNAGMQGTFLWKFCGKVSFIIVLYIFYSCLENSPIRWFDENIFQYLVCEFNLLKCYLCIAPLNDRTTLYLAFGNRYFICYALIGNLLFLLINLMTSSAVFLSSILPNLSLSLFEFSFWCIIIVWPDLYMYYSVLNLWVKDV